MNETKLKTVFISIPFKGRTNEAILETIKKIENTLIVILGSNIIIYNNFMTPNIPIGADKSIYCKAKAIEKIAECDYICYVRDEIKYNHSHPVNNCCHVDVIVGYRGCYIEQMVARMYDIKEINLGNIDLYCPDLVYKG